MDTVLEASHLGKRYGKQWALRECSLRAFRPGQARRT